MVDLLKLYHEIEESAAEKICKNIALALQNSNLAYYEYPDWIEIIYRNSCIAFRQTSYPESTKYRSLLYNALDWCLRSGLIDDFCPEQALLNIDLYEEE